MILMHHELSDPTQLFQLRPGTRNLTRQNGRRRPPHVGARGALSKAFRLKPVRGQWRTASSFPAA